MSTFRNCTKLRRNLKKKNSERCYFGFCCLLELSFCCFLGMAPFEGLSVVGTSFSTSIGVADGVDDVADGVDDVADGVDGVTFAASHAVFLLW